MDSAGSSGSDPAAKSRARRGIQPLDATQIACLAEFSRLQAGLGSMAFYVPPSTPALNGSSEATASSSSGGKRKATSEVVGASTADKLLRTLDAFRTAVSEHSNHIFFRTNPNLTNPNLKQGNSMMMGPIGMRAHGRQMVLSRSILVLTGLSDNRRCTPLQDF